VLVVAEASPLTTSYPGASSGRLSVMSRLWERRYIARELYRVLLSSVAVSTSLIGTTSRVEEAEIV
jgi:hypothetical protein